MVNDNWLIIIHTKLITNSLVEVSDIFEVTQGVEAVIRIYDSGDSLICLKFTSSCYQIRIHSSSKLDELGLHLSVVLLEDLDQVGDSWMKAVLIALLLPLEMLLILGSTSFINLFSFHLI